MGDDQLSYNIENLQNSHRTLAKGSLPWASCSEAVMLTNMPVL